MGSKSKKGEKMTTEEMVAQVADGNVGRPTIQIQDKSTLPSTIFRTNRVEPGGCYETAVIYKTEVEWSNWWRLWRFLVFHWNLFVDKFHIGPWGEED